MLKNNNQTTAKNNLSFSMFIRRKISWNHYWNNQGQVAILHYCVKEWSMKDAGVDGAPLYILYDHSLHLTTRLTWQVKPFNNNSSKWRTWPIRVTCKSSEISPSLKNPSHSSKESKVFYDSVLFWIDFILSCFSSLQWADRLVLQTVDNRLQAQAVTYNLTTGSSKLSDPPVSTVGPSPLTVTVQLLKLLYCNTFII